MTRRAVLVMAKAPAPGRSKTRLAGRLSAEGAADLSACFIRDAVALAAAGLELHDKSNNFEVAVAVSPPDAGTEFDNLLPGVPQVPQRGNHLGERLDHVMAASLDQGFDQVVAINADGPNLPSGYLAAAFAQLDRSEVDLVLGPTDDGGYYLIGQKERHPRVVTDVEMSTPNVLRDTLAIAAELDLTTELLEHWYDVDEPEDLDRLIADIEVGVPCGVATVEHLRARGLLPA